MQKYLSKTCDIFKSQQSVYISSKNILNFNEWFISQIKITLGLKENFIVINISQHQNNNITIVIAMTW